ncbi:MAG: carboxymethylenebutenolidase [Caulobacterales bacterium 32-69-10]|nr:MAG: carboxymethylenebutenolidase [Caulobacterales bacterium 32-69-10]
MSERITVSTADGDFAAYVAAPKGDGPFPAVVVIQEIFGINGFVRLVADRLAEQGYLAVAPDLFWRIEPGVELTDQSEAEWKKAFELMNAFDLDQGIKDIAATIDKARADPRCSGKVGAVGYCLGGLLAFLTALRTDADASVSYYGVNIDKFLGEAEGFTRPLMLHIAEEDGFVNKEAQAKIVTALAGKPNIEVHTYPGRDHAFARDGGQHYDAADAGKAADRTADFFKRTLG